MMQSDILSQNIILHRKNCKLTKKELADKSGLSYLTIKKIESASVLPRWESIVKIARALNVMEHVLLKAPKMLHAVRFRSKKAFKKDQRMLILNRVGNWLEDYCWLEKTAEGGNFRDSLKNFRDKTLSPVELAKQARMKFGLKPDEPIDDICMLMDSIGLKLKSQLFNSDEAFGICLGEEDGGPAIVFNDDPGISFERKQFSIAHEFGHLLMHFDGFDVNNAVTSTTEKKEADAFAGAFLMPDNAFIHMWQRAQGRDFVERVLFVKQYFRVSYKSVIHRLMESEHGRENLPIDFSERYNAKYAKKLGVNEEPYGLGAVLVCNNRYLMYVRKLLLNSTISSSRAAELLGIRLEGINRIVADWNMT